jgi:membrane protein DedA with SNARE-associated domain
MVENLVNLLEIYVLPWGAFGVFVASVLEEVVAPIPSALIMTMSGFIFVTGGVSFASISTLIFVVAIPAALGVTVGSYFIYFIARYGGKFTIEKWGKYIGLYSSDIEKLQNKLSGTKKDEILIGSARILPIVPSVAISAFCGIMEMNLVKYFFITLIGTFFRGLILGAIGWQVGNVYEMYADIIGSIEKIVLLSTIFGLAVFVVLKYKGRLGN